MKKWQLFKLCTSALLLVALMITTFIIASPGAKAATTWPTYKSGNSGENVTSIQYMLRAHGFSLAADGKFGPTTTQRVKDFQGKNGLTKDGVVGPNTWGKLIVMTKQGSKGDAVIALQRQLNAHGASISTDGQFGSGTAQAVKSFQSKNGLGADGVAGPQTWQALVGKASTPTPPTTGDRLTKVVQYAKDIEAGKAEPGWHGGRIPYSWDAGHGNKPGPSLGSCNGYTGSIHPCPADKTVGLDCSGFTRWVYSLAYGRDILGPYGTAVQITKFHKISASQARPGDLIFYGSSPSHTHHVAIYIGNGKMINAPHTGAYVRTDNVSGPSGFLGYYRYNG